jgi:hypothetical protein
MPQTAPNPRTRRDGLINQKNNFSDGEIINLGKLAKAVGVSPEFMSREIKADTSFPIVSFGTNGTKYEINALVAIDYLIAACDAKIAASNSESDQEQAIASVEYSGPTVDTLNLSRLASMTMKVEDAKFVQGTRCEAALVIDLFQGQSRRHIEAVMGVTHRFDPTNLLPPDQRKLVDELMRGVANYMKSSDEREIQKFRADIERSRNQR